MEKNLSTINARKNILAIGAHPDDIELGCGGVLSKHLERDDNVYALVLTNGESGNHTPSREECLSSLMLLGIKRENILFGNFPDGYISDDRKTVNLIENYIQKYEIHRVYTHYPNDRHQDHRYCSNAVVSAARKIQEIFFFEGPSTKVPFEPHYFIEISPKHLKKKLTALKCYRTQIKKKIVDPKATQTLALLHGLRHHAKYAEAFALNHVVRGGLDV